MNDKEEDLFRWYLEESRTNDGIGRICPYSGMDEVRIPRSSGYDSDLEVVSACRLPDMLYTYCYEKENLVDSKTCREWVVAQSQCYRRRYGVMQVTASLVRLPTRRKDE